MASPRLADALRRVLGPAGPELGCDECFDRLDAYVEAGLAGGGALADAAVPGMRAHLAGCPACREEHDSLRALVAGEPAGPPAPRARGGHRRTGRGSRSVRRR
ncbi:hypothetical protein [Miltoncostaea marina]|uniref:hypothetical protein n=1 Tax=Miltoncostaea marina TaxID=2843215 RepID=UPI001C3E2571|nr:hypothetical protein [Miltoncostaea marina]